MRYIKRNILIVILMVTIFLLTGCGKSYEKKIEEKYGIEIETDDKDDLKKVDTYFSKLPKGFIEELKKYDDYDNRTIKIVLKSHMTNRHVLNMILVQEIAGT